MADVGTGATITFGTSGFTADHVELTPPELAREALETTRLIDTVETSMPADLIKSGEVDMTFNFDPDTDPPIDQAAETVTLTFPIPAGKTTGATWVFPGFMTNYKPGKIDHGVMKGSATVKVAGDVTKTPSA